MLADGVPYRFTGTACPVSIVGQPARIGQRLIQSVFFRWLHDVLHCSSAGRSDGIWRNASVLHCQRWMVPSTTPSTGRMHYSLRMPGSYPFYHYLNIGVERKAMAGCQHGAILFKQQHVHWEPHEKQGENTDWCWSTDLDVWIKGLLAFCRRDKEGMHLFAQSIAGGGYLLYRRCKVEIKVFPSNFGLQKKTSAFFAVFQGAEAAVTVFHFQENSILLRDCKDTFEKIVFWRRSWLIHI